MKTLRLLGMILAWAEHPVRNVRCNDSNPENIPYLRLNKLGEFIVKITGGWPEEEK